MYKKIEEKSTLISLRNIINPKSAPKNINTNHRINTKNTLDLIRDVMYNTYK